MKILHILGDRKLPRDPDNEAASGVVRVALETARAQQRNGNQVWVVAVGRASWSAEWYGVQLRSLPVASWALFRIGGKVLDFRVHVPLVLFTHRYAFDVIQGSPYYYMRFLRARAHFVNVQTDPYHEANSDQQRDQVATNLRTIAQTTDGQIAASHFIADRLKRGINLNTTIRVVYNGIDGERFAPERLRDSRPRIRNEWGIGDEQIVFLFAGAIVPEKGVLHLARVFAHLIERYPHVRLVCAGSSKLWGEGITDADPHHNYEANVRETLRVPLATGNAILLGKVKASAMADVYAAADVVVIPSVWGDPFPLVALEALAAGRPVIASRTGGLAEAVNEENGILVKAGDEAELEDAMEQIITATELRLRKGRSAQKHSQNFSWDKVANQLNDVYANVLATRVR